MAYTFSITNYNAVVAASNSMKKTTAVELPFHDDVIQALEKPAVAAGLFTTTGAFKEAARDRPISVLIDFIALVGKP